MSNHLGRIPLTAVLGVVLVARARAESIDTAEHQLIAGIVVVSAAAAVGITFLILHEKHKANVIIGCVSPDTGGLRMTDEKDKRIFTLTGDTAGIKPGERMKIEGKRRAGGTSATFEVRKTEKDLGACQP